MDAPYTAFFPGLDSAQNIGRFSEVIACGRDGGATQPEGQRVSIGGCAGIPSLCSFSFARGGKGFSGQMPGMGGAASTESSFGFAIGGNGGDVVASCSPSASGATGGRGGDANTINSQIGIAVSGNGGMGGGGCLPGAVGGQVLQRLVLTPEYVLFDYIERFYNRKRRHSTLGYLAPDQYEATMAKAA